jgi:hypothetical protein
LVPAAENLSDRGAKARPYQAPNDRVASPKQQTWDAIDYRFIHQILKWHPERFDILDAYYEIGRPDVVPLKSDGREQRSGILGDRCWRHAGTDRDSRSSVFEGACVPGNGKVVDPIADLPCEAH